MATVIYNCKNCKIGRRIEYAEFEVSSRYLGSYARLQRIDGSGRKVEPGVFVMATGGGKPTVYAGDLEAGICAGCGRAMEHSKLAARFVPSVKCNSRCTHARGGDCDCSCGGKNHGIGWVS